MTDAPLPQRSSRRPVDGWVDGWVDGVRRVFGLDPRALAVFRVGLGLMVFFDALMRVVDVELFYSENGVAPRGGGGVDVVSFLWRPSLYSFSDTVAWATVLLVATAIAGAFLMLGWRTRLMTAIACFLVLSVQHRNENINTGADQVLITLLFIGLFLPLSQTLSVDARRRRGTARHAATASTAVVLSGASLALLLQLVLIYFINVLNKDGAGWFNGLAVLQTLHIDHHATPLGIWVRESIPWISAPLTYGTLAIEGAVLFLFVPNPRVRVVLVGLMCSMHLGFAVCMYLGLFSPLCMVAWVAVLPPSVWDALGRRLPVFAVDNHRGGATPSDVFPLDGAATVDHDAKRSPQRRPLLRRSMAWLGGALALMLIMLQLGVNVSRLKGSGFSMPAAPSRVARALRVNLSWRMFGDPGRNDGWWVIPAKLADGRTVDVFQGRTPPSFKKPKNVGQTYGTARWRKLMMNIMSESGGRGTRRSLAHWYCRTWNREHDGDDAMVSVTMVFMSERTHDDFRQRAPKRIEMEKTTCRR
jgi:hypothetical protein